MKMIIGGAYQGKTDYAVNACGVPRDEIIDGKDCAPGEALTAGCIKNFHLLIKRLGDPVGLAEKIINQNNGIIIISDEISCGIFPLDINERKWRELTGKVCGLLAANCDEVIRINCGIPTVIKGSRQ
jgi:adenosyl cobinamide kinase/adenosyl cobinamide phosphate guanylyltransferase